MLVKFVNSMYKIKKDFRRVVCNSKMEALKSFYQAKSDVKPLFSHVIVHFVIGNFPLATLA